MTNLANQLEALSAAATPGHWTTLEGQRIAQEYATKSRTDLCQGSMSDLELANRQYMAGRGDLDLITWQTASKERIRWLSVQLALALRAADEAEALRARVAELRESLELADAMLRGANMNRVVCERKISKALGDKP